MADTKISNLPTGTYNSGDFIVVVDVTTNPYTSKKLALSQIPSGGTVTPYNAVFAASYTTTKLPFYNSTATSTANWTITDTGTRTATAATISDGTTTVNITSGTSGTTAALRSTGLTLGGTCTGTGSDGTSKTITFSGSVPTIPIYTPAWLEQTSSNVPPTFSTTDPVVPSPPLTNFPYQTAGSQVGASITYPTALLATQYNWICTTRPAANVFVTTTFGNVAINPDVTASQTIGGVSFNVFGISTLIVGQALTLTIT